MAQLHGKWIRKGNYEQETLIIVCAMKWQRGPHFWYRMSKTKVRLLL